jgi:HEPN domain-containing protein
MNAQPEETARKVRQWVAYADEDLILARHGLTLPEHPPLRLIAYHAQQCAEKYLKGFLVWRGIDFPYTHNIARLLELVATQGTWSDAIVDAATLTPFAITARYPGEDAEVERDEVEAAIAIAERVRQTVRQVLADEKLSLE